MNLIICIFFCGILFGFFINIFIYYLSQRKALEIQIPHSKSENRLQSQNPTFIQNNTSSENTVRKIINISIQSPLMSLLNGFLYTLIYHRYSMSTEFILYCLLFSTLLVLSVIDFRTYEIPIITNLFILLLGVIRVITDWKNISDYLIGFFVVSAFLFFIYIVTNKKGIGGGDVKLMAVCGLVLGWKLIVLGFFLGCIIGSICHIIRMKIFHTGNVLAMGPYLSAGVMVATLYGNQMISWYIAML